MACADSTRKRANEVPGIEIGTPAPPRHAAFALGNRASIPFEVPVTVRTELELLALYDDAQSFSSEGLKALRDA